jgi:hypothetical protein
MIFTPNQWRTVYYKHRAHDSVKLITRPSELIIAILDQDAVEFGIHPSWVEWWNHGEGSDYNGRWANTVCVMLQYGITHKMFLETWSKPRD